MNLDRSQLDFCKARPVNIRLLAPAGCGKTLCLLHRCKFLAELDDSRNTRFLIVTFTRAAQQELSTRLIEDSDFLAIRDSIEISTLNSWGFRRIKNSTTSPKLVTKKRDLHFAMLNQIQPVWSKDKHSNIRDSIQGSNAWRKSNAPRNLVKAIDEFKSLGFDHLKHSNYEQFGLHWDGLRTQGLGSRLENLCADLVKYGVIDSEDIEGAIENKKWRVVYKDFFEFWRDAVVQLINSATFTLVDQKYYAYQDECKKIESGSYLSGAARYNHILVDEFQDINPLDLALVKAIAIRNRATITIAGDDDQAVFEWRGASTEYILNPAKYFQSEFETHRLGVNYRSPANIVKMSQMLIANNCRREAKQTEAFSAKEAKIEVKNTGDLSASLDYVSCLVESSVEQGKSPSKVAIIGRKKSQLIPYQVHFASKGIPFCAAEDLQMFMGDAFERLLNLLEIKARSNFGRQRKAVEDVLALCDLVKRYQIKQKEKTPLIRHLHQHSPANILDAFDVLSSYEGPLKGKNVAGNMSKTMAKAARKFIEAGSVSDSLLELSNHFEGLQYDMGKAEDDIFYTDPPFFHLAEYAHRYGEDYERFIDDIERAKRTLVHMPPFEEGEQFNLWEHPLHLMTAIRAKGKEFDTVVLLDVTEDIWPNRNAETTEEFEAERRVFYVAFTRAREKVVMLVPERIGKRGSTSTPSRYIEELGIPF